MPTPKRHNPITPETWMSWLGSTVITSVGIVAFAYATFVTQREYDQHTSGVYRRIERIELKIDALLRRSFMLPDESKKQIEKDDGIFLDDEMEVTNTVQKKSSGRADPLPAKQKPPFSIIYDL